MEKKTPKGLKELSGMSVNRVMRMYNLKEECENMDLPELIVNLRKCIAFHLDPYNLGDECKTTFLINKLIEYASQDKWISVKDKSFLEDGEQYIVELAFKSENCVICAMYENDKFINLEDKQVVFDNVIRYQPLPLPLNQSKTDN